jgi:putative hemolysin
MIYLELAAIIALIVTNGLLALAELAIVSSRRARLRMLAERNVKGARRALALASSPGRFLSTVQIGITFVGILSGAFSGATLGHRLALWLSDHGIPPGISQTLGVGLVVALITYASLIIGELVPKQIALRDAEAMAVRVSPMMTRLALIASPLVSILDGSGAFVLSLLGYKAKDKSHVTDEEIRILIAEAEAAGVIETREREMISGVMRRGDRPIRALMTPRPEVEMHDLSDNAETLRRMILASTHSRLPVHEGNPDQILGVVQAKDLLDAHLQGHSPDIRAQIRTALIILDTADALDAVDKIKSSSVHIALVHDEYGHFEGVVTNADILAAIVGALKTDRGPAEPDAVLCEDGSWLISGRMPIDEMAERLAIVIPQGRGYHTAAGFVLDEVGRLPECGESFVASGWRFKIVDLDGRRIDKILATRFPSDGRA